MARKIKPSEVAAQFDWDILSLRDFAGEILEDANDHNIALALFALRFGGTDLAIEFLKLEKAVEAAGYLTAELNQKRSQLLDQLSVLRKQ